MSTVSERQRLDLYERLGETLGRDHAEVLMEYLPPVGWNDVARRHDLDLLRADTQSLGTELRSEMRTLGTELRSEMQTLGTELRSEMQTLGTELRSEMQTLGTELRSEMQVLRSEVGSQLDGLRVEVHQQFARQLIWLVGTILASVGAVLGLIAYVS